MTCRALMEERGKEERIYLVELTIWSLKLLPDKAEDLICYEPEVKIKFMDLPIFVISKNDFIYISNDDDNNNDNKSLIYDKDKGYMFSCGKSCLFIKKPKDLVHLMKSTSLRVGIFRRGDTFPIGETNVSLSGCLCDQTSMADNDRDHLPVPYELKGIYNLTDVGKTFSGL